MKKKFDSFIHEKYVNLVKLIEQDEIPTDAPPDMGVEDPPSTGLENKVVSTGYAYFVNIIFMLLKYPTDDINPKFLNLSDNRATNSKEAFRYIDVLTKLLPTSVISDLKNDTFGDIEEIPKDQIINIDEPTVVEMANVAIKCLFYYPKDNLEFSSKIEDIRETLSQSENKVNIKNANAVYQQIKDFVSMSQ
jgi:hypothetical protein